MWIAVLFAAFQAAAPLPAFTNSDFEARDPGGAVAGWRLMPEDAHETYRFDILDGAGHLAPVDGASPQALAAAAQTFDAAALRGRLVRFRARVRLARSGGSAILAMSVRRPDPKYGGFNDRLGDRPIVAQEWATYETIGRVARDALRITVQVIARGGAEVLIDDASVEPVAPDPAPPSPEAVAFLDTAIALLREQHIDSGRADWPRIIANAHAEIGGGRTPADTYRAILGVIGELGEPHTMLWPPRPPQADGGGSRGPERPLPEHRLVESRYGLVHLPGFLGAPEAGRRYTQAVRDGLIEMAGAGICGWIVDLRDNDGGNMWPMLAGLDPLLGEPPFGAFVTPQGDMQYWSRTPDGLYPAAEIGRGPPAFALSGADLPVALLFGPRTASSGEMTAIALIGRHDVRSFGATTAGFTTGNAPIALSDGGTLVLTGTYIRGRDGHEYQGPVIPDVPVDPAGAEAVATAWLAAQPACRAR